MWLTFPLGTDHEIKQNTMSHFTAWGSLSWFRLIKSQLEIAVSMEEDIPVPLSTLACTRACLGAWSHEHGLLGLSCQDSASRAQSAHKSDQQSRARLTRPVAPSFSETPKLLTSLLVLTMRKKSGEETHSTPTTQHAIKQPTPGVARM